MNKNKDVIVVEGQSDVNKLCLLVDADFVITNGSEISRETIEYIKTLSLTRRIIILTDPDYPGMRIREIISQAVPNALHAYVDRDKASNGKKLGVAECQKEEILRALQMVRCYEKKKEEEFDETKMYSLGLTGTPYSSLLRERIYKKYNLGYGNAKTLCKRLNMIDVTFEEIKEFLSSDFKEEGK
ncbi:MAG: ribonuclease M5 [Bacilli bacterium]